jgi:hypothetical protein
MSAAGAYQERSGGESDSSPRSRSATASSFTAVASAKLGKAPEQRRAHEASAVERKRGGKCISVRALWQSLHFLNLRWPDPASAKPELADSAFAGPQIAFNGVYLTAWTGKDARHTANLMHVSGSWSEQNTVGRDLGAEAAPEPAAPIESEQARYAQFSTTNPYYGHGDSLTRAARSAGRLRERRWWPCGYSNAKIDAGFRSAKGALSRLRWTQGAGSCHRTHAMGTIPY